MSSPFSIEQLQLVFTRNLSENVMNHRQEEHQQNLPAVKVHLGDGAVFQCPTSMLREGCRAFSELLEDAGEEGTTLKQLKLPLPTLNSTVFCIVATYLEHFYGPISDHVAKGGKDIHQTNLHGDRPAILSAVLQLRELYHLSNWEHLFVVQQLLSWPQDRWRLSEGGDWVDISAAEIADTPSMHHQCLQRLLNVLEAATVLDIPSLKNLCGAIIANMLLSLDERQIFDLMNVTRTFGSEEERSLMKDFPWLNV